MKKRRDPHPYPIIGPRWRPTWEEYAEVVTGMSEAEVRAGLAKIIRKHGGLGDVDSHTLEALARAGMVGTSPDFRKTLRPSFSRADPKALASSLRSFELALPRTDPDRGIWVVLLERALTACRRMGFLPAIESGKPEDRHPGYPAESGIPQTCAGAPGRSRRRRPRRKAKTG